MSQALEDIAAERQRQMEVEGWTPAHDDEHADHEMGRAAAAYAFHGSLPAYPTFSPPPGYWPWDASWWKPKGRRRDLVRAGALIVAEIERLDREDANRPVRFELGNGGDPATAPIRK